MSVPVPSVSQVVTSLRHVHPFLSLLDFSLFQDTGVDIWGSIYLRETFLVTLFLASEVNKNLSLYLPMSSRCANSSGLLSCTEGLFSVTAYMCTLSLQEQDILAYVRALKKVNDETDCFPKVWSDKMSGPQDSFKLCKCPVFLSIAHSI